MSVRITLTEKFIVERKMSKIFEKISANKLPIKIDGWVRNMVALKDLVEKLRTAMVEVERLRILEREADLIDLDFLDIGDDVSASSTVEISVDDDATLVAASECSRSVIFERPDAVDCVEYDPTSFIDTETFAGFDINVQLALLNFYSLKDKSNDVYLVSEDSKLTPLRDNTKSFDAGWSYLGKRYKHDLMYCNSNDGTELDPYPHGYCWLNYFVEEEHAWLKEKYDPMMYAEDIVALLATYPDTVLANTNKNIYRYETVYTDDGVLLGCHVTSGKVNVPNNCKSGSAFSLLAHTFVEESCRTQEEADHVYPALMNHLVWYSENVRGIRELAFRVDGHAFVKHDHVTCLRNLVRKYADKKVQRKMEKEILREKSYCNKCMK